MEQNVRKMHETWTEWPQRTKGAAADAIQQICEGFDDDDDDSDRQTRLASDW